MRPDSSRRLMDADKVTVTNTEQETTTTIHEVTTLLQPSLLQLFHSVLSTDLM